MELNIKTISVAHQKDKTIKIFDNSEECLKFANEFEKKYNIKLSCDSLENFLVTVSNEGYFQGHKDANGR